MSLNKQKGNMYAFVSHTWNPIKGECIHDCKYCYMKRWGKLPELHLDQKALNDYLGRGNFIFIGSGTDIFADNIPDDWLNKVAINCKRYPFNTYLFQTKNPENYAYTLARHFYKYKSVEAINIIPNVIFGTTIETNRNYHISKAPSVSERVEAMVLLKACHPAIRIMVTIEPIMDFDLIPLLFLLKRISPEWVNIGADSSGSKLPEPSWSKVRELIEGLKLVTTVKCKNNLNRLNNP